MKKLIALMGLFASISTLSSTLSIVKIDDGTWAHCRSKADAWRFRNQAYSVSEISISREEEKLTLNMNVQMKQCVEKSGQFDFEVVNPLEDYFFEVPWATGGPNLVRNETKSIGFQAHRDGVYEVLFKGPLKKARNNNQIVNAKIPLDRLLSAQEKKVLFEENGAVQVSYDFYLQRMVKTSSANNPEYAPTQMKNYGSFRFHLNLESIGGSEVIIGKIIHRAPNY